MLITFTKNNTAPNKKCQGISAPRCNLCGEVKSPKDFYLSNKVRCKECVKRRSRTWHKNNPQRANELHAEYRTSPDYRKKQAEFYRQWYAENGRQRAENWQDVTILWCKSNPKACRAYGKVSRAVKAGELKKPIHCSRCGVERKLLGHHNDYELPLEVEWLCYSCHKKLDHSFLFTPKPNTVEKSA